MIVAAFLNETEEAAFVAVMRAAGQPRLSAASLLEVVMVLSGRFGDDVRYDVRKFLDGLDMQVEAVTEDRAWVAADAFLRFGKGRHPAALNFGGCFAYALAKELGLPLLYKGGDFARTDIPAAL